MGIDICIPRNNAFCVLPDFTYKVLYYYTSFYGIFIVDLRQGPQKLQRKQL